MKKTVNNKNGFSIIELLIVIVLLIIVGGIGFYVAKNLYKKAATPSSSGSTSQSSVSNSNSPTISTTAMAGDLLSYLKTYYIQNGQYPQSDNNGMDSLVWQYGYDFRNGGASSQTCPQWNGFMSYASQTNQQTNLVDTFNLDYCVGNKTTEKTQSSINTYTASDAVNRVKYAYSSVLSYEQENTGGPSQAEVDSIQNDLSPTLYNELSAALRTSSQDPILCIQSNLPNSITASASVTSNNTDTVTVVESFSATSTTKTTTVELSNLQITGITCPQ